MHQIERVNTAFTGLIGWRQSTVAGCPTITAENLASSSGLFLTDFSPLNDVYNIYQLQEDSEISDPDFNTVLANIQKAAFQKVCYSLFAEDDFCENKLLFTEPSKVTDLLDNDSKFVGFKIKQPNGNYIIVINSVITTFDSIDSVKLLCFHTSKQAAIFNKSIATEVLDETEISLGWVLPYNHGEYYIGYLRGSLTAKAVKRYYTEIAKFHTTKVDTIYVDHNTETLFDIEDVKYSSDNYGLNLNISIYKDFTTLIENNANRFVKAIALQVSIDVCDMIIKSTRSNIKERNLKPAALFEKEGLITMDANSPKVNSLVKRLKDELHTLKNSLTGSYQLIQGTL